MSPRPYVTFSEVIVKISIPDVLAKLGILGMCWRRRPGPGEVVGHVEMKWLFLAQRRTVRNVAKRFLTVVGEIERQFNWLRSSKIIAMVIRLAGQLPHSFRVRRAYGLYDEWKVFGLSSPAATRAAQCSRYRSTSSATVTLADTIGRDDP